MNNEELEFSSRTERKMNDILKQFIEYGFKVRFTNKTMVDTAELKQHFSELRESIREDIQEAQEIKEMRNRVLEEAHNEADMLVNKAREELEKQDVIRQANEYARKIALEAQHEADVLLNEATALKYQLIAEGYEFLEKCMENAESYMEEARKSLHNDQDALHENRKKLQEQIKSELTKMRNLKEKNSSDQRYA
jgi:hypothetical protein